MYISRDSCQILTKPELSLQILDNTQISNCIKNRLVAAELLNAGGVTGITKPNSRFSQFCLHA